MTITTLLGIAIDLIASPIILAPVLCVSSCGALGALIVLIKELIY